MLVSFHANCVVAEEQHGFWLVGLADSKLATRKYLTLQRSIAHDEQDVRLGMNTYHVERNSQNWSCYGGIDRFELQRNSATIAFTKEAALQLGKATKMEITFQLDDSQFDNLRARLQQVFSGTNRLEITAERDTAADRGSVKRFS